MKSPGSRYRRTTRFHFWRTLGVAALLSLPAMVAFFLTGWTTSIASLIPASKDIPWLAHSAIFGTITFLLLGLFAAFHNRLQIEKLGAGAATISLSAKSSTYFDEYLDEIVYLFEISKRDIVIFEDIDRFDEPHIFETLRSLNLILNGAKQLKGRKIRFIYAIKDSIFDELGARSVKEESPGNDPTPSTDTDGKQADAADAEMARANRTKFFDLVIPVVPFVTHRSARDLLVQTLREDLEHTVSTELIDLTARYVADMRLIKNIRNEFAIFKYQLIDNSNLELNENSLFAMVLYKCTHLSDFELVRLGKSNLDDLYHDGRQLVAHNLEVLNKSIRTSRLRKQQIATAADRAKRLGDALWTYLESIFELFPGMQMHQMIFDGAVVDGEHLRSPEFWDTMASSDATFSISYYNRYLDAINLSRAQIEHIVGEGLHPDTWAQAERKDLDDAIAAASAERDFISHADMADLMTHTELRMPVGEGKELNFEEIARKRLHSELLISLLTAGYIDRNFTLYTSRFYSDRVSANAMNYLLKNIDPNVIDMHFPLHPDDVAAILRERGRTILREKKSTYNVSVLDYLAKCDDDGLALLLERLIMQGDEEREFLLTYFETGKEKAKVVAAASKQWPRVFAFIATEAELDITTKLSLFDAALATASADITYECSDEVGALLAENYGDLTTFTTDTTSLEVAERAAELVEGAKVKLPSLAGLAQTVKRSIVARGAYMITRGNLLLALNETQHSLALDFIRQTDEDVYTNVLAHLTAYLTTLDEDEPTVAAASEFPSILDDVLEVDAKSLEAIVERSAEECVVPELSEVASGTWAALANHDRFPTSFANVKAYVEEFGINDSLARILESAGVIEDVPSGDEDAKIELGLSILRNNSELFSPRLTARLRAELVGSLHLKSHLEATAIPVEHGELLGWLLVEKVVKDEAATFAALENGDVDGLAFAISKSQDFATFMTTEQVTPSNVGLIFDHPSVPQPVKEAIRENFTGFTRGTPLSGLTSIAHYCVTHGRQLAFDGVAHLASEGVHSDLVLPLLEGHLATIEINELTPVLRNLGGAYANLAARNGKRPRIPNTSANRSLAERVIELGLARTFTPANVEIQVNMRQKA